MTTASIVVGFLLLLVAIIAVRDPGAGAHTVFLSNFFGAIAEQATATLRPKYGRQILALGLDSEPQARCRSALTNSTSPPRSVAYPSG